jgi:cyclic pyranopterin phosphate synthase
LIDSYGRVAKDLRVSLTDRCNLRCEYCMPPEGLEWQPTESVLTDAEVLRLIRIATTALGVEEVRFTGGEPLLRQGLGELIRGTKAVNSDVEVSLTTNGLGLEHRIVDLVEAGLDRINVSLDTIRPDDFYKITRRDRLEDVISGIEATIQTRLRPIKINAVLLRGINHDQAPELLAWCLDRGLELRFVEQMPLDAQHGWSRENMVTGAEILESLSATVDMTLDPEPRGSAPAQTYLINGGPQRVGVIASVTQPFCGDCDRVRLTADGLVRNCLFARSESDLRTPLRAGASDTELAEIWLRAMYGKQPGHGINDIKFLQPARSMSAIGG